MTPTLVWAGVVALAIICMTIVFIIAAIKAPPGPPAGKPKNHDDLTYNPNHREDA